MYLRYPSSTVPTLESHIVTSCPLYKPFFFEDKKKETESQSAGRDRNISESGNPRIPMKFVTSFFWFVSSIFPHLGPHLPIPPRAYMLVGFISRHPGAYLYICTDCTVCKVLVNFFYIFGFLNVW